MKILTIFLYALLSAACTNGKEVTYTGSTPADAVVRSFLGIPQKDSVDFIRWKLSISERQYTLLCNYGVGKPNTSGFIDGGNTISIKGQVQTKNDYHLLSNGNEKLKIAALNINLLHISDIDGSFLRGNGGWSYTLNNVQPEASNNISSTQQSLILKDSMIFEGRTPCGVPGIIEPGALCYKLKWYIVLYGNAEKNTATTYKVFGTPWREKGGRKGNWQITKTNDGSIRYQLNDDTGKGFLYLLKADEGILLFTAANGEILTGNEDFSFTLNKVS